MTSTALTVLLGTSPAPAAVLEALQELTVTTSADVAGTFRLRLGIAPGPDGSWPLLDPDLFAPGRAVRLGVAVDRPLPTFLLVGYVAGVSVVYGGGDAAPSVEVSGVDATALMNLEDRTVAWPNLPDALIATQVLASHGLVPRVQPTGPVLVEPEGTTVQRGSDIRFLRRLARRNGFVVHVLPEANTGVEVGHFAPLPTSGPPVATLAVRAGEATGVHDLRVTYDMLAPTEAVAAGLDLRHSGSSGSASAPSATVGRTSTVSQSPRTAVTRLTGTGLTASADLQRAAQALVDRSSHALVAQGQVPATTGPLRPGDLVALAGAGASHSGPWVVRQVRHVITPGSYVQHFTATRNATGSPLLAGVGG